MGDVLRVFIGQPMRNKEPKDIEAERLSIIETLNTTYPNAEIEIIDSYFKDFITDDLNYKNKPLAYLAKSLDLLATADLAVFTPDWEDARGCRIERECAKAYGIQTAIVLPITI